VPPTPSDTVAAALAATPALLVALLGWGLHIRSCRETLRALREENRRLIETLARLAER
jgi:hypothetical protein